MAKTTKKEETAAAVQEGKKEENTADAGRSAEAKKENPGMKGPRMYVGPTVSGIGIQNRVYTEIPEDAKEKAKETPEINHLFIPVRSYPVANQMFREKKGYIYTAFCKVSTLRNGGNE